MATRGKGEGSIGQTKDGLWCAKLPLPKGPNGERRRLTLYAPTKKELQAKVLDAQVRTSAGTLSNPSAITVAQYAQGWVEGLAERNLSPNTIACYEDTIRRYVNPYIGARPLQKITPEQLDGLFLALRDADKSPRVRQLTYGVLSQIFDKAVKRRLLPSNPIAAVEPPQVPKVKKGAWDEETALKFLAANMDDRLFPLYLLSITGAFRQGELLGLQWTNVDFLNAMLHVEHTLLEVRHKIVGLGPPKSDAGLRNMPLPKAAIQALRKHRERLMAEGLAASPWVFPSLEGTNILKDSLRRSFGRAVRRAGVPRIPFHNLRHTSLTLSNGHGVDLKTLQVRAGHADIRLTGNTYVQGVDHLQRAASDKMDAMLAKLGGVK